MTKVVALLALALAAAAAAIAAEPAKVDPELQETVRSMLRGLDSPQLARRDQCEKKLIELGPAVLPLLPEDSERSTAELRQRLERIRNVIIRARDEAFIQGTTVTLDGKQKLSVILTEIEKQTGNKLIDYREQFGQEVTDPELELNFKNVPFWKAMDQLLDQANLTIYPFAEQQALAIVALAEPQQVPRFRPGIYHGAFRIEGTKFLAERDLRSTKMGSLDLTVEVAWEPRLKPIVFGQTLADVTATDDRGEAIAVTAESELESPVNPGTTAAEIPIPLAPPSRQAKEIAKLNGKLVALLPGGVESFRFPNLAAAKNVEQRRGGAVVTLEQARKNNAVWEVRMIVRFDQPRSALESYRGWVFNNEAFLETADGQQLKPDGYETTRQTDTEIGIAYLFDLNDDLAGKTFVYRSPTVLIDLPLEYTLEHLPLP